jgi:hypothetical protein
MYRQLADIHKSQAQESFTRELRALKNCLPIRGEKQPPIHTALQIKQQASSAQYKPAATTAGCAVHH